MGTSPRSSTSAYADADGLFGLSLAAQFPPELRNFRIGRGFLNLDAGPKGV
jgi:hypothetical protein